MECRILKKGCCEITWNYNINHQAIDIVGKNYILDYIVSHSKGKVIFSQDGYNNLKGSKGNIGYGNFVKIDNGNGYHTLYAHMKKGLFVKNGDYVKKGQVIGYMSDSGNAYGAHLHFEVLKDGIRINPLNYLNKDFNNEKIKYLSNKNYTGVSIVDALKQIGIDSSFDYRSKLASINNISNYRGTAEQNLKLLELLKNGTLISFN